MDKSENSAISFFEKNLTYWVALCMVIGVLIGKFAPTVPAFLAKFEYANVSIPIAILIWLMIYPMMMKVDFASVKNVGKNPKGLFVTWVVNWLIKPFTMFGIAAFFFYVAFKPWISPELAKDYLAGAVLLGAAPCTAMVFVWSHLTRGNAAYTVVQVATNDLIILVAFTPIVAFLLGIGGITIPWMTLIVSVLLFVVVPLIGGVFTRNLVIRSKGEEYFQNAFIPKFNNITIAGLLLTLVLIFSFQGEVIINNPLHIVLIAVPLIIQTVLIFFLAYGACYRLHCHHDVAAPAGMIGASNFFELAVAVAITLFGAASPVVLATIVGVLVEVPVMLALVAYANRTSGSFSQFEANRGDQQKLTKSELVWNSSESRYFSSSRLSPKSSAAICHTFVARTQALQATLDLLIAGPRKEDITEAKAMLKRYEAELSQIQHDLKDASLDAPSDGVVQNRILEVGDMASPQKTVYTVALTDPVWVRAYVAEPDLGKVFEGMKADVITDSFPDKRYEGWVGFISPSAEFTPKPVETRELRSKLVYQIRVFVRNPNNELRLGMPATGKIRLDQIRGGETSGAAKSNPSIAEDSAE